MPEKFTVLFFIKAPERGLVKSRLAAAIGDDRALELYRSFILDVVGMLEDTKYPFRICCYPAAGVGTVIDWLGTERQYMAQEGNDLGERMENAFGRVFSEGLDRAVLIGSDIPDLTASLMNDAVASLEQNDVVLGPASDGGYYLIGSNRETFLPDLFHGISWSTAEVFRQTMNRVQAAGLRVHLLPEWSDVDSVADLQSLFTRNRSTAFRGSRTMAYLGGCRDLLFR
jgi:rSAM/selenodomain-associated transferase 1